MPRPKRPRCILSRPAISAFIPEGERPNGETILSLEELEAVRLVDLENMDQSQGAEIMNVSRQTFGRILKAGRSKVADAVVNARCLRIDGGCFRMHGKGHGPGPGGAGRGRRRRSGRRNNPVNGPGNAPGPENRGSTINE